MGVTDRPHPLFFRGELIRDLAPVIKVGCAPAFLDEIRLAVDSPGCPLPPSSQPRTSALCLGAPFHRCQLSSEPTAHSTNERKQPLLTDALISHAGRVLRSKVFVPSLSELVWNL